jgi:hypothetical protein
MNGRCDATGRRRTRSRASVAARQVVATHSVAEVEPVWPQEEVEAHGVVDDEPRDVLRHPDAWRSQSSRQRAA